MSVGIRVFEMAAVGRLSIRPSRLASEDLPELDSPADGEGAAAWSRRCMCACRRARPGTALSRAEWPFPAWLRAACSSATIRPVSAVVRHDGYQFWGTSLELQTCVPLPKVNRCAAMGCELSEAALAINRRRDAGRWLTLLPLWSVVSRT